LPNSRIDVDKLHIRLISPDDEATRQRASLGCRFIEYPHRPHARCVILGKALPAIRQLIAIRKP